MQEIAGSNPAWPTETVVECAGSHNTLSRCQSGFDSRHDRLHWDGNSLKQRSFERLQTLWWYCAMRGHLKDSVMERIFEAAWKQCNDAMDKDKGYILPMPAEGMFWRWRSEEKS
jgi:hypothetical protein